MCHRAVNPAVLFCGHEVVPNFVDDGHGHVEVTGTGTCVHCGAQARMHPSLKILWEGRAE